MTSHDRSLGTVSGGAILPALATMRLKQIFAPAMMLLALACYAQQQPATPEVQNAEPPVAMQEPAPEAASPENAPSERGSASVTVPAGTRFALVLTHSIQTRYIHRGDDIYAQIISPITSGNEVVIPPGTFVQGKVDRLARKGGRGELYLQSMEAIFPDGYVVPISGPTVLETDDGYALKDPGSGRVTAALTMPIAGAGLGALIGHSAASSQGTTITSTLPPGCTGPPPGCLSSSVTGLPDKGKDTVIGAAIGGASGAVTSMVLLFSSHNFFLDVGSPVEMILQQPLTLPQDQVDDAVRQSDQHPAPPQPIAGRPVPLPPPNPDHGTCYTPGTPGTPDTVIPGAPGPDGIPGPPTIIPGIPPTPGTPYPCP
ncbi:MAG: hypothetical protein WB510_17855 [Candidatus Sulfotelmatobacter sp.]